MTKGKRTKPNENTEPLSKEEKKYAVDVWLEFKHVLDKQPLCKTRQKIYEKMYNSVRR